MRDFGWLERREAMRLLGVGGMALVASQPGRVHAAATKNTLVLGLDISDTISLDPAREAQYTPPLTLEAAYEALVTMTPGDYLNVKPALASVWARTPNGQGWRFTLRDGAKFNSGNPVTVEDVKWTLERVMNVKDQPSQYLAEIDRIEIVDPRTIDVILKHPEAPMLTVLCGPTNGILERKVVEAHGGSAAANANTEDKATNWLNQNSAGAGAYTLVGWTRNAQILLTRNPHYWRGLAPFERVVIRHMSDSATQLLAVKCGDIDAAFNLIPEQVSTLKGDPNVRVEGLESLDFVYMALTSEPEYSKALAVKAARQAIGWAIDYDGITNSLLGGKALRCASFIPIGLYGSTKETTGQIGYHEDLEKGQDATKNGRLSRRVRVQTELWRCSGVGSVLRRAGAKITGRPGAGGDQGPVGSDGPGQSSHPVYHRQVDCSPDVLEPLRRGNRRLGVGHGATGSQARAHDTVAGTGETDAGRCGGDRSGEEIGDVYRLSKSHHRSG